MKKKWLDYKNLKKLKLKDKDFWMKQEKENWKNQKDKYGCNKKYKRHQRKIIKKELLNCKNNWMNQMNNCNFKENCWNSILVVNLLKERNNIILKIVKVKAIRKALIKNNKLNLYIQKIMKMKNFQFIF